MRAHTHTHTHTNCQRTPRLSFAPDWWRSSPASLSFIFPLSSAAAAVFGPRNGVITRALITVKGRHETTFKRHEQKPDKCWKIHQNAKWLTHIHTHALAISFRLKSFYINIYISPHTHTHTSVYVELCMCAHALVLYAHVHACVCVCECECVVIGSLRHADDIMQRRRRQQSAKHLSQLPSVPLNVRVCVPVCQCVSACGCVSVCGLGER